MSAARVSRVACAAAQVQNQRENQEDSWYASFGPNEMVAGVFDGVGGSAGGEVASRAATDSLASWAAQVAAPPGPAVRAAASSALETCHDAVREAQTNFGFRNASSTAVIAVFPDKLTWFGISWAGDSRAYLWRPRFGPPRALTRDHSQGRFITRGLGFSIDGRNHSRAYEESVGIEAGISSISTQARRGVLLLCTDGAWNETENFDAVLELACMSCYDAKNALLYSPGEAAVKIVQTIVEASTRSGARDNATALAVVME